MVKYIFRATFMFLRHGHSYLIWNKLFIPFGARAVFLYQNYQLGFSGSSGTPKENRNPSHLEICPQNFPGWIGGQGDFSVLQGYSPKEGCQETAGDDKHYLEGCRPRGCGRPSHLRSRREAWALNIRSPRQLMLRVQQLRLGVSAFQEALFPLNL